jgi:5-methylcytosine-specific restriction endonuclease McrA
MTRRNYDDPAYEQFRKDVLKRDGRKCMMPGCGYKKYLQVHHIKKWSTASSLRYEPSNGITLCKNCHKSIKGQEHHYESLFMEIINAL